MDNQPNQFTIDLPIFSGPLDLLLHLVQKEQVSIWDVSLAQVTEEYLRFLDTMQELNLEVTCEFLVLAATLVQIKARSLLPKPTTVVDDEEYETEESLLFRLIEYKKFKMAADGFLARADRENQVFTKLYPDLALSNEGDKPQPTVDSSASVWDLLDIMQELLHVQATEVEPKQKPQVPRKLVSLADTILTLRNRFQGGYRCSFRELLLEAESRAELIATFLASLELVKLGVIILVRQGSTNVELRSER